MTIFAVFKATEPEALHGAIMKAFPNDHVRLTSDEWLISADMTPKEVSDKIGVSSPTGNEGAAIVFSMRGYFGRAPSDIWDWIKTKTEAAGG